MKSPDDASFQKWAENPEPSLTELEPQTILDCNIDGQAWLYNTHNESTEWLTYKGEPVDLRR